MVFDQSRMISCLRRLLLPYDHLHGSQLTTPLNEFRGLTGYDLTLASPSPSDPGAKAQIDTVQMFFFETPRQARQAQGALAQIYVYFRGPFASLRYLRPIPPNKAALHSIERIAGNVDIFWQYPRHHPVESDRTLNGCLASSQT